MKSSSWRVPLTLGIILAIGLGFRLWGITWGLYDATVSTRPHPDEWPIYWLFQWFNGSHSLNPCLSAGNGQCFFDWGMVFPYLAYLLHFLLVPLIRILPFSFGPHADPQFVQTVLAGRIVSAIISTATIYVVFLLAKRLFSPAVGLVAALLLAFSGLAIQLGHFATPDSTTLFLVTCTLLAAQAAWSRPTLQRFALTGVALGLVTGSEFHMALLAIPIAVAWLLSSDRRIESLLLSFGIGLVTFLAVNPYILVEFPAFWSATIHSLRIRTVDSGLEYGDRFSPYGPAWLYVIRFSLGYGVGFAFTGWMLAGALWSFLRRRPADYFLLAWLAPYFVLVTLSPAKFMRYSAPLLIPLVILGARLATEIFERMPEVHVPRPRIRWALLLSAALAGILAVAYTSIYDAAYVGVLASPDPRLVAVQWISGHSSPSAYVGFSEKPDGLLNLPYFAEAAGFKPCIANFHVNRLDGATYVLSDRYVSEEHPLATDAQVASYWRALRHNSSFKVALSVTRVPTFLGVKFPIGGSPHDWRYAAHNIAVFVNTKAPTPSSYCYPSVAAIPASTWQQGQIADGSTQP